MKFAICNEIFRDWSLADTFECAREAGYDAIELAPFTLTPNVYELTQARRREIRELARRTGLSITGLHWVLVQTEGLHLTHPDPVVRQRTAEYFVALVEACADLGGTHIIVGSPKQRNLGEGVPHEQGWKWATEVFHRSVQRAEQLKVTICIEPLAPEETNFLNTAAEAIRFSRQFDSSSMSVILDVKAMSSEGRSIPDIIRESRGAFDYFHANDPNLKGPGFGEMDFRPIAEALKEVEYDGHVSVEVFRFEEGPEVIAKQSRAYLRETFGM